MGGDFKVFKVMIYSAATEWLKAIDVAQLDNISVCSECVKYSHCAGVCNPGIDQNSRVMDIFDLLQKKIRSTHKLINKLMHPDKTRNPGSITKKFEILGFNFCTNLKFQIYTSKTIVLNKFGVI